MAAFTFKPQHQGSAIDRLLQATNGIKYFNKTIAPELKNMEKWEAKEYQAVKAEQEAEYKDMLAYVQSNTELFDKNLSGYGLDTATFIKRHATL